MRISLISERVLVTGIIKKILFGINQNRESVLSKTYEIEPISLAGGYKLITITDRNGK